MLQRCWHVRLALPQRRWVQRRKDQEIAAAAERGLEQDQPAEKRAVRWEQVLSQAKSDHPIFEHFKNCAKKKLWGDIVLQHEAWAKEFGSPTTGPLGVQLGTESLLLVQQAHRAALENSKSNRSRQLKLMREIAEGLDPSQTRAKRLAVSLYLSALKLARGDKDRKGKVLEEVERCVDDALTHGYDLEPEGYAAALEVLTEWHRDPRPLWERISSRRPFPRHPDLFTALVSAASQLRCPRFASDIAAAAPVRTPREHLLRLLHITCVEGGTLGEIDGVLRVFDTGKGENYIADGVLVECLEGVYEYPNGKRRGLAGTVARSLLRYGYQGKHVPPHLGVHLGGFSLLSLETDDEAVQAFLQGAKEWWKDVQYLPESKTPGREGWFDILAARLAEHQGAPAVQRLLQAARKGEDPRAAALAAAVLFRSGDEAAAEEFCTSSLPLLALLRCSQGRSYERQFETLFTKVSSEHGFTPSARCYNACIVLACQGDNLDGALQWLARLVKTSPKNFLSNEAAAHLLYSACSCGDGLLAVSIVTEMSNRGMQLSKDVANRSLGALKTVDWRGAATDKLRAALQEHEESVLQDRRSKMLKAVNKATEKARMRE